MSGGGTQVAPKGSDPVGLGNMVERLRAQCVQLTSQAIRVQESYTRVTGYEYIREDSSAPEMPENHPHMARMGAAMDDIDRTITQLNNLAGHMEDFL